MQFGATTAEIPQSTSEYERYRDSDADTAFKAHLREYNRWWVDNVPYIDLPDRNVKKMSYYRTFLNRFNLFDGDIPGNDYQFPVSIEGVLGYNNAIQLTQPMHMQDLKYFRDPLYAYGDWVSSGESSKCTAFTDNPGNTANWNNNIQQWIGAEAWQAYLVHGGERAILRNLAKYAECDVKGQLAKFDDNHNSLVEYASGFYTGNDSDAVALAFYNTPGTGRNADRPRAGPHRDRVLALDRAGLRRSLLAAGGEREGGRDDRAGGHAQERGPEPLGQHGQGLQAARRPDRQPDPVEGPAELLTVRRGTGPEHGRVPPGAALLGRRRPVLDHALLHRQPRGQGRGRGGRQAGLEQLLEHQRDAAGAVVRPRVARIPDRLHHARHVPQAARVAELDAVRQR